MKKYKLFLLTVLVVVVGGCREDAPELIDPNETLYDTSPSSVFKAYWHGMNNSYAFWDIDPTDWDKVYDDYLPKFEELDKQKVVESEKLKELYTEITRDLIDSHYRLKVVNTKTADNKEEFVVSPSSEAVKRREYYHASINAVEFGDDLLVAVNNNIKRGRIKNEMGGESTVYVYPNDSVKLLSYSFNIDNGIAYIYLSAFNISGILENSADPTKELALQAVDNFSEMIHMPDIKGVIVDVRNNGGGNLADMQHIFAPMLDEKLLIGYTRSKNGMGRFDYGPWVPCIIDPANKSRKIEVPIVALVDLYSVSMSELTAMAIAELPNGYVVGERTYGGTGPLIDLYSITYGGQFKNNSLVCYSSTSVWKRVSGEIVEGKGVTPDVEVLYNREELLKGNDVQLERAIQLIHEKSK